MRIALVRQKYTPFGGGERFVERALAALRTAGVGVTLLTRHWRATPDQPVIVCDPPHLGRLWRDRGFALAVRATLARERFDLVQSHERIAGCDIYRAGDGVHATWLELRDRARSGPARLATRLSPWHRYTLAAEAAMFRHAALRAVICNSRMVADDIATRFGVSRDKLQVIYNGVDLEHFHPRLRASERAATRRELGIDDAVPVFLYVGSGYERKGVATLLEAFAAGEFAAARLWIVGRDRHEASYRQRAARLGVGARVAFLGPRPDLRPYYGAADVAVLPTYYDPFPNVALEALACGLPLVTTRQCGAAELITDGGNGAVIDAGDAPALTAAMLACAGGGPAMAAAARESVAALSIERTAAALTALYLRLLGRSATTGAMAPLVELQPAIAKPEGGEK